MSINKSTALDMNKLNQVLVNERNESLVEETTSSSTFKSEDGPLATDNDEHSFVKGYN